MSSPSRALSTKAPLACSSSWAIACNGSSIYYLTTNCITIAAFFVSQLWPPTPSTVGCQGAVVSGYRPAERVHSQIHILHLNHVLGSSWTQAILQKSHAGHPAHLKVWPLPPKPFSFWRLGSLGIRSQAAAISKTRVSSNWWGQMSISPSESISKRKKHDHGNPHF